MRVINRRKRIDILDCTLRDGSYLIDYQFTAEDTYLITLGLARAGFQWIEIGHGTGLGSFRSRKVVSAATDEEYIKAAKKAIAKTDARIGMFFIPGIGTMDDVLMAHRLGIHFVRIGTNVTEIDQARPFIEKAKSLGMTVCSNLMKSYAVSAKEFVALAKQVDRFGSDVITVVDSAGGMFPEDVKDYVEGLRKATNKRIGFHGHNNLQLAVANTLQAIRSGADMVDSSLQGIGRSAGNAQTEILVMVTDKFGYKTGIDTYKTLDLGERIIRPMVTHAQGVDAISLVSGIAQFHSGFLPIIYEVAEKQNIDPRLLITEVSRIDRSNITQELVEKAAVRIHKDSREPKKLTRMPINKNIVIRRSFGKPIEQVKTVLKELVSRSRKSAKSSVFTLSLSRGEKRSFPFLRENHSFVIANIEAVSLDEIRLIIPEIDGQVDWILLDESCNDLRCSSIVTTIKQSRLPGIQRSGCFYRVCVLS